MFLHQHLLQPPADAMKLSPASSLPIRRVVETPFPASLSVKRASFYLGNRRRRKGVFTVGAPWCGADQGCSWLAMGRAAAPSQPPYAGRGWATARVGEVAGGPAAAGLGPCPAVDMQGVAFATGTLWDKFKRTLPVVWWQKDS